MAEGKPAEDNAKGEPTPRKKASAKKPAKNADGKIKMRCQVSLMPEDRAKLEVIGLKLNMNTGELVESLIGKLITSQEKKMKAAGTHRTFMKMVKATQEA